MAQPRTARAGLAFIFGIVGFSLIGILAYRLKDNTPAIDPYEAKRAAARVEARESIEKEANEKLYAPASWVDKSKGTVRLPIERAMELTVATLKAKPAAPTAIKAETIPTVVVPPQVLEARNAAAAAAEATAPAEAEAAKEAAPAVPAVDAPSAEAPAAAAPSAEGNSAGVPEAVTPEATPAVKSEN